MDQLRPTLDAWLARGEEVAVATVVDCVGSAPRPPGGKLAVSGSGEIAGGVSGGCAEGAVVAAAEEVLRGGAPRLLHFGVADSELVAIGLPCGGEVTIWVERLALDSLPAADERAAVLTRLDDGRKLAIAADGAVTGTLGARDLDRAAIGAGSELMWLQRPERRIIMGVDVFADVSWPRPRLMIFGAIDFAAPLCTFARAAGWRPSVADPRSAFARPERFADAEEVVAAWPEEAVARLGGIDGATSIAVLTHDSKLDDAALSLALRSDAAYIGAMGSRRMRARRHERLLAAGFTEAELARVATPIGLDLGGVTPEETALSILAEIVACRRGRAGGRLREASGPIHDRAPTFAGGTT